MRGASEANLVDTLELIMEKPLRPLSFEALKPFGCLRQLRLVQQHINTLEGVGVCGKLQLLHLPENQIEKLDGRIGIPFRSIAIVDVQCSRLTFHIIYAKIQRFGAMHHGAGLGIEACKHLEELDLSSNRLSDLGASETPSCPLSSPSGGPVVSLLHGMQQLHTLRLNSNRLKTLKGLGALLNLKELQVADNELTHVGAYVCNNRKLEKLNVAAN